MRFTILVFSILALAATISVFTFSQDLDLKLGQKDSDQSDSTLQKGEGLITQCSYRAGDEICGSCYCLKADEKNSLIFNRRKLRGCARLDISEVGDLAAFVGRRVYYELSSDFDSTFICPQHFKLIAIRLLEEKS